MTGPDIAYHEGLFVDRERGELRLWRRKVADLVLTTGNIVLRDALIPEDFVLRGGVAAGTYPFVLTLVVLPGETDPRPVAATVEFTSTPPKLWDRAKRRGRFPWLHWTVRDHCVPIDSWHLGILDEDAASAWNRFARGIPRDRDLLREEHAANDGLWNVHSFAGTFANMVTCFSGMGSGAYPAYWGTAGRETVCLVVDFQVVEPPQDRRVIRAASASP